MTLKLVLPKGRINTKVLKLLSDCGINLVGDDRNYRPTAYGFDLEVKLLKSQNIPSLIELGQHDIGFAGLDWIQGRRSNVEILKDESNIEIKDKKYEIIKFSENINEDTPGYNLVGLRVKDLNKIPTHLTGMRFPKRHYKSVTISMEEFMNSEDLVKQIYKNSELDDYFIIEYDLYNKALYNKLIITIYYPIKE